MPIHDWTRVDAGLFHDFHQSWTVALKNALNEGNLPEEYFALVEQHLHGPIADVLTLHLNAGSETPENAAGDRGLAVATAPPQTRLFRRNEADIYAGQANRVTIRHRHGDVVAVIEIVSPGNKGSRNELRVFLEKTTDLIRQRVHLLVVDLFPPGPRDPQGVCKAIWDVVGEEAFELPEDKQLTLASYDAGPPRAVYAEFVEVGDTLPNMPLFLRPGYYIPAPLEGSYNTTWNLFPRAMKRLVDAPSAT